MILTEDYFDDIEIKDSDLEDNSSTLSNTASEPDDAKLLLKHRFSEYSSFIEIFMNTYPYAPFDVYTNYSFWNSAERMIKRLNYMLDVYGIKHSEPFFVQERDWISDICYNGEINGYHMLDFKKKYRIVAPVGIENPRTIRHTDIVMVVFFDLPVFKTVKSGYKFIYNLSNSIWKDLNRKFFHYRVRRPVNHKSPEIVSDIKFKDGYMTLKGKTRHLKINLIYLVPEHEQEINKVKTEMEMLDLIKNR